MVYSFARYALTSLLFVFSASSLAQTEFEKIEAGTILTKAGIKLGVFVKPIPLPDGEWLVVSKGIEELPLTSRSSSNTAIAPAKRIWLTLKNKQPSDSPLIALVMSFTPEAFNINWGNRKCENTRPNVLVEDFGLTPESLTYACGNAWSLTNYKTRVATAAESKNNWDRNNLSALSHYADEIPDKVLEVTVYGNQYRGRNMSFTFLLKRDAEFQSDSAYAQYVKDWMHTTGLSLINVLKNDAASFSLPAPFGAQASL